MRRVSCILAVCFAVALGLHVAYYGAAETKVSSDWVSGKISRAASLTYGMLESVILPAGMKTAALESDSEEKAESAEGAESKESIESGKSPGDEESAAEVKDDGVPAWDKDTIMWLPST
jgi:hypothetical protein